MPAWFRYGDEAIQYLEGTGQKAGGCHGQDRQNPAVHHPRSLYRPDFQRRQPADFKKAAATVWGRLQEAVGVISPGLRQR